MLHEFTEKKLRGQRQTNPRGTTPANATDDHPCDKRQNDEEYDA